VRYYILPFSKKLRPREKERIMNSGKIHKWIWLRAQLRVHT
jgi:hypothetical protein